MHFAPPPRTLLDLAHPINRACVAALLLNDGQGVKLHDSSVMRNDASFTHNGQSQPYPACPWHPSRRGGLAFRMTAPGAMVAATIGNHTPPTGEMTVMVEYLPFALADYYPVVDQWNEGGNKRSWAIVVFSSGIVYAYASSDGANYREYNSNATTLVPGKPYRIIVGYPNSGGATTININGVDISTGTSGSQAYSGLFNTAQQIWFGYSPAFAGSTLGANAAIGNFRLWNRLLSLEEKVQLNVQPYIGYRVPSKMKIYAMGAGGASPAPTWRPRTIMY